MRDHAVYYMGGLAVGSWGLRLECDVIEDSVIGIRSQAVPPIRLAKRIGGRRGDEWCSSGTRRFVAR